MVQELRNSNLGGISDPRVPELIAHLEIRTRHIRQSVMQTGSYAFSRILDFVGDQDFFVRFLERKLQNDPSMLRESILKELFQKGLPRNMLEPIMKMAKPLIPHFMARMKPMLPMIAAELRRVVIEKLPKWAKSSHIKGLMKTMAPELKIQRYKELTYYILPAEDDSLILGDSAVLFKVAGPRPYKVILEKDDILRCIFCLSVLEPF